MKTIEVRRHAPSDKEKNVSREGLRLANQTIPRLRQSYDACYCSPKKRTSQTLEAFGFTDAKRVDEFDTLPGDRLKPHMPLVEALVAEQRCELIAGLLAIEPTRAILEETAAAFLRGLKQVAAELPDEGHALVVSHGGAIEPAVMMARNDWDLSAMGGPLRECEAAVFEVEGDSVVAVTFDRRLA